ncbi:MAG: DUF3298 domain-containing protein [Candidatus Pacebacteria bacterium]|nr:DUF3298 domain-containing protein [Candidatus Paceibacterota bacterium]
MKKHKKDIIILIVCLAILVALVSIGFKTSDLEPEPTIADLQTQAWPSEKLEDIKVSEKTEHYDINAVYPKTNSDIITNYFKSYVENQIVTFKEDTSWVNEIQSASSASLTLDINYSFVGSDNVQNYIFSTASYTGGAHGLQFRKTFSFNKEGQLLTLSNIFFNGLDDLNAFSTLVQKELSKRSDVNQEWLSDGAGPNPENYQSFVVTDQGITVLFDPYQVASYASGNIDISIPTSSFSKIANPEIFSTQ